MIATDQIESIHLDSITDMRPIDWYTGKRVPLMPDEGHCCERCGRIHAIIWTIRIEMKNGTGLTMLVGSGCGQRSLDWEPTKPELKSARKEAREKKQAMIDAKRDELVKMIADKLAPLTAPAIEYTGEEIKSEVHNGYSSYVWVCGDAKVWAQNPDNLNDERKRCLIGSWRRNRAKEIANEIGIPGMFAEWEIVRRACNRVTSGA